jgi:hypothetical protein
VPLTPAVGWRGAVLGWPLELGNKQLSLCPFTLTFTEYLDVQERLLCWSTTPVPAAPGVWDQNLCALHAPAGRHVSG